MLVRFRREKETYNKMLRHEADHMRARGAQARVGTLCSGTLIIGSLYGFMIKRVVKMAGY